MRPMTPGRGFTGLSATEAPRPYTPSDPTPRYDGVAGNRPPPTPNPALGPHHASLLNPSRPFTAAENKRGDTVFSRSVEESDPSSMFMGGSYRPGSFSMPPATGPVAAAAPRRTVAGTGSLSLSMMTSAAAAGGAVRPSTSYSGFSAASSAAPTAAPKPSVSERPRSGDRRPRAAADSSSVRSFN
jgi:hypothetical protein